LELINIFFSFFSSLFFRKQNSLELMAKSGATAVSPSGGPAGRGEGRGRGDHLIEIIFT
jgi:hypothetical protein